MKIGKQYINKRWVRLIVAGAALAVYFNFRPAVFFLNIGCDLCFKAVLLAGSSRYQVNTSGESLLHLAVRKNNFDATKFLLDIGLDVDTPDADSSADTPLFDCAFSCKDTRILKLLISRGADVKRQNNYGETALHFSDWNPVTTTFLLQQGLDPNQRRLPFESEPNEPGLTVLQGAYLTGDPRVLRLLLQAGGDPLLKLGFGRNLIESSRAFCDESFDDWKKFRILYEWEVKHLGTKKPIPRKCVYPPKPSRI